jgi:hypothetical protein
LLLALEAFRVNFVDGLCPRRPRGKPSIRGGDLDASDGIAISSGRRRDGDRFLAGKLRGVNVLRRYVFAAFCSVVAAASDRL